MECLKNSRISQQKITTILDKYKSLWITLKKIINNLFKVHICVYWKEFLPYKWSFMYSCKKLA